MMKNFLHVAALAVITTITSLSAGCSKDKTEPTPPTTPTSTKITITLGETTSKSVKAAIHPENPNFSYCAYAVSKELFKKNWNNDVAAFLAYYIETLAKQEGITKQEVINNHLKTIGDLDFYQQDLTTWTEYVLFAVGIDNNGAPTTSPEIEEFIPTPISITLDEITSNTVKATIHPEDPEMVYYSHVIAKASFQEKWDSDVNKFMPEYIAYLAEGEGITEEEVVEQFIKTTGDFNFNQQGIDASTEYVLFAVAIDKQGKPTSKPTIKEFVSLDVVMQDCSFALEVSKETITSANIKITPSKDDLPYLSGVVKAASWPSDSEKQKAYIQEFAWLMIEAAAKEYSIELLDAIPYIIAKGEKTKQIASGTLAPDTDYLAVAFGLDKYGNVTTLTGTKPFSTLPANASANTFKVTVDKTAIGALINVTTTNEDPYYVSIFTKSSLGTSTDNQIITSVIAGGAAEATLNGSQQILDWEENLISETEYVVVVFGCDEWATTKLSRTPFTTEKGGDPANCTFDFETTTNNFLLSVALTPSDNTVFYYYEPMLKEDYPASDDLLIEDINAQIQDEISMQPDKPVSDILYELCLRGKMDFKEKVSPGSTYILWALALDSKTGLVAGNVTKKEVAIPPRTVSTATVSLASTKYYDHTALNALDPNTYPKEYNGYAYAVLNLSTSSNAVVWYAVIFAEDLTNKSDDAVIINLTQQNAPLSGKQFTTNVFFNDEEYYGMQMQNTLCAVAQDADGNFGPVIKQLYVAERTKVSPVSDLIKKANSVVIPYRPGMQPLAKSATAAKKMGQHSKNSHNAVTNFTRNLKAEQEAAAKRQRTQEPEAVQSIRAYGFSSAK